MPHQSGTRFTVRCSDDDAALLEKAAHIEGFSTLQQWMLVISRRKAREVLQEHHVAEIERLLQALADLPKDGSNREAKKIGVELNNVLGEAIGIRRMG